MMSYWHLADLLSSQGGRFSRFRLFGVIGIFFLCYVFSLHESTSLLLEFHPFLLKIASPVATGNDLLRFWS